MQEGKWVEPRYTNKDIFEKDYSKLELSGTEVKCPGCKAPVVVNRKTVQGKMAGWCRICNRAATR